MRSPFWNRLNRWVPGLLQSSEVFYLVPKRPRRLHSLSLLQKIYACRQNYTQHHAKTNLFFTLLTCFHHFIQCINPSIHPPVFRLIKTHISMMFFHLAAHFFIHRTSSLHSILLFINRSSLPNSHTLTERFSFDLIFTSVFKMESFQQ